MKKLIYCALALAAGLFATSCMQENLEPVQGGSTVTYTVNVPEVATKAIGDAQNVNKLVYAVYRVTNENEADAKANLTAEKFVYQDTHPVANGKSTISLELINNQAYLVLFWAQVDNTWFADDYQFGTKTVAYPANLEANNDKYSAFYGVSYISDVQGPATKDITLHRPFAQINIAANDPQNYNVKINTASVTVANAASGFDVAKEEALVTPGYSVSFAAAPMPGNEKLTVNDVTYETGVQNTGSKENDKHHYVAMNYVFAAGNVNVSYVINTDHGEVSNTITNVPVAKNFRTNIVGNLLTSDVKYNVTLDNKWGQSDLAPDDIYMAAALGGEVTLTEDVVLTLPLEINAEMTINLDGHTISGAIEKGNGAIVKIADGASVILNGGTIKNTVANGDAAINNEGTLVLNGVTIEGAPLADGGYSAYAVVSSGNMVIEEGTAISADRGSLQVTGAGETVINGGTFTNNDIGSRAFTSHVVDVSSTHKLTINGGTFQHLHTNTSGGVVICNRTRGTVYVNGGSFSGGNYYGNDNLSDYGYGGTFSVKGGVFSANPAAKYIADGYKAIAKDGKYYVVTEDTGAIASSSAELVSLVNNATEDITVSLAADLEGNISLTQKAGIDVTILGNGHNYKGGIHIWGNGASDDRSLTIKEINFDGTGLTDDEGCIYTTGAVNGTNSYACNVTIEDCTFTGAGVAAIRQNVAGEKDWTIRNCTVASDMHSLLQVSNTNGELVVENCKVYSKNGANLNSTCVATFTGCEFDVRGYAVRVGVNSGGNPDATKLYTFTNCTLKSETVDGDDAVIIIRKDAQKATLNFVNSELIGDPTITGHENATVYINGVLQVANKVLHAESGLYYNGIDQNHKSVFYVESAADLRKAAAYFTGQTHTNEANYVTIELLTNINLAGQDWTPWDVMWVNLNGNNFTISNMNVPACWRGGLFGYAGGVKVNDLTIKNATVSGAQTGILIGAAEGATVNNVKIAGNNTVTYIPYSAGTYTETWGGIGAFTGLFAGSTVNGEILPSATVTLNYNDIVTNASYINKLIGYTAGNYSNNGTITNSGSVESVGKINSQGVSYVFDYNASTLNIESKAEYGNTVYRGWISDGSNYGITNIVVSDGITRLNNRAFCKNTQLKTVSLPNTLTYIDESVFQQSGFTSITIPKNVTYIGKTAFGACPALETIIINAEDVEIEDYCARDCPNLKSVYIYSDSITFKPGSMYFTNSQNNNTSSITYYVASQTIADAVKASIDTGHAKGAVIKNIDGTEIYYTIQ